MSYSSALAEKLETMKVEYHVLLENENPTPEDLEAAKAKDAELDALEKQFADARNLEEKAEARRKQEKTPLRLINTGGSNGNGNGSSSDYSLPEMKSWADEVLDSANFKAAMERNDFRQVRIELPNRSLFRPRPGFKAAGDPIMATQFGTRYTDMTLIPHVFPPIGVIDLIGVENLTATNVRYFTATNPIAVNGTAFIAEGAAKPEVQPRWTTVDAPIETVADWTAVTLQALDDIPQLRPAIDSDLRNCVEQVVDNILLNGTGTSPQPRGILNFAGIQNVAFVATTSAADMIAKGIAAVQTGGYGKPNAVVMNPADWWAARVAKSTQGIYYYGNLTEVGTAQIFGLPVVTDPNLAAGVALVGDFSFATIYQRMGITFIVGLKNDDLIKNLQTIVCEERMTLAVRRPGAFAKVALV